MEDSLSVIICTHNPRPDYLRRTIDALHAQTLPMERWEFLLIDNASKTQLKDAWDISWHPRGRHVREDEVGLTAARLRGIKESGGDFVVFIDDDNVLAPDFLHNALSIRAAHPFLGVFGAGVLEPEFEVDPAPELKPHLHRLALRSVAEPLWSNNTRDYECTPWGAGLCVTRPVANDFLKVINHFNATSVLGRQGQRLFSGEDDVFSWVSTLAGLGFGIFPRLRITHLISAGRLNRRYFLRLICDHAYSHGVLDYLRIGSLPKRAGWTQYAHLSLHGLRHGIFAMQCQWAAVKGEAGAARFIAEKGLRPIQVNFLQPTQSPATGENRGPVREQTIVR